MADLTSIFYTIKIGFIRINFDSSKCHIKLISNDTSSLVDVPDLTRFFFISPRDLEGNNINYIHDQAFATFTQLEDL